SYVSSLPTDEYLAYFGELTLEFTGVDKVNYSGTGISVKHDGEELPDVAVTTDANKLTLTLKEALNFVDGKIEVAIAPESLTGVKGTVTAANLDPITAIYSMATPVVYDLTLLLNAPKINSAGEISADRSMSEMFFVCENKDLVAAAGAAPNVFLRSEEGDFEVSAHLTKGKGLNANYSYFVANFLKQPSYNGKYVITINKGAVGTAAWGEDPNYGHSNEALTLSFELVDGASRDIYSIQPISVTPSEGSYSKGSDIGVITFFFEEGISPVKGVSAMLAGIDTSYREETTFTATKDGGYALTFSPAPSEKGRYLLNVPQGAFGDAGFVANGDGKGSAPMSFTYYIGVVSGIEGIEETNPEAPHTIYNVQGLQIDSSIDKLPAGLYIIDGKKVVINKK
ncbi:MAG: hypothetical protein K2G23_03635, partial [Muribaculaceae bacterium]|nr:hypothetical protein [Muribaculaceae bacterium]